MVSGVTVEKSIFAGHETVATTWAVSCSRLGVRVPRGAPKMLKSEGLQTFQPSLFLFSFEFVATLSPLGFWKRPLILSTADVISSLETRR